MKKLLKRGIKVRYLAGCIILAILLALFAGGCGAKKNESPKISWKKHRKETARFLMSDQGNTNISTVGGEGSLIAVMMSDIEVKESLCDEYYKNLCDITKERKGVLDEDDASTYARIIIALSFLEKDPRNVAGYNLVQPLDDVEKVRAQGVNSEIYALVASGSTEIALENARVYLNDIMEFLKPGGDLEEDPDAAGYYGMALQAISYYSDEEEVEDRIKYVCDKIRHIQESDGGFGSCESTAKVIMGLTAAGKDPQDGSFTKNDKDPVDALMEFATKKGFGSSKEGETDIVSSEQALSALNDLVFLKRINNFVEWRLK
jgi:hypothetical protein